MASKQHVTIIAVGCAALLVGAALEHLRLSSQVPKGETPARASASDDSARRISAPDDSAVRSAEILRRRVSELERQLAQRESRRTRPAAQEPVAEEESDTAREPARRQSWEERMERMRTEEPERYAEMQQRRDEFRQRMEQTARDRSDFLDAIDVDGMTQEQRANHERLLETVARATELGAQMMQSGFGRGEEGRELRQEMGEVMMALGPLYEAERQYLLETTAKAVGYSGSEATAFATHIQSIFDNTSMMPGGMGPGMGSAFGRRGGPGGGPGGRGGGGR